MGLFDSSLIESVHTALDRADMILGVFDKFQFACVFLVALAYTLRLIWIGIQMSTTGKFDLLHEFTQRSWKIWLAMILSYMSLAPSYSTPPEWLKQDASSPLTPASIVLEAKKILLTDISKRFEVVSDSSANVGAAVFESKLAEYEKKVLLSEDLNNELKEHFAKLNWTDGYGGVARLDRLIGLIRAQYNIDSLMDWGLGLFSGAMILNTGVSVAGAVMDFTFMGTGNSNIHLISNATTLTLLSSMVMTGLLMIGFALAVAINFFVLDLQFLILSHLSPLFLLLFAFEATKRFADALINAFVKNLLASVMVYFCVGLAIHVFWIDDVIRRIFGIALIFALPRYAQQLVADLVGGFATPSEDMLSSGRSAQSFNALGHGVPGGLETVRKRGDKARQRAEDKRDKEAEAAREKEAEAKKFGTTGASPTHLAASSLQSNSFVGRPLSTINSSPQNS